MCSNPDCKRQREELEGELRRLRSTGYDMLKQRGEWQSGGKNHDSLSQDFQEFFDQEVYEMTERLKESSVDEDDARKLLCEIFQKTYDECKEQVLDRMQQTLRKIVSVKINEFDEVQSVSGEDLYDASRAYGLLLHASGAIRESESDAASQKVCEEMLLERCKNLPRADVKAFGSKLSSLSRNLLTIVPPLIVAQPDTPFSERIHERECSPIWKANLDDYKLVYYRPMLFRSYSGDVAENCRAWVGNKENKEDQEAHADSKKNLEENQTVPETMQAGVDDVSQHKHLEFEANTQVESVETKFQSYKHQGDEQQVSEMRGCEPTTSSEQCTDVLIMIPEPPHSVPKRRSSYTEAMDNPVTAPAACNSSAVQSFEPKSPPKTCIPLLCFAAFSVVFLLVMLYRNLKVEYQNKYTL